MILNDIIIQNIALLLYHKTYLENEDLKNLILLIFFLFIILKIKLNYFEWIRNVLLLIHCCFIFVGESVDDCGGGYSESVAEMCDELQNGSLPLLVLTPNGRDDAGTNKDCFLLNPAAKSSLHMEMFRFLGTFSFPVYCTT